MYRDLSVMKPLRIIRRFCRSKDGITSVEYCVTIAKIVIAAIYGIMATGAGGRVRLAPIWAPTGSDPKQSRTV